MSGGFAPFWVVGFSGHRHIDEADALRKIIKNELGELSARVPGRLFAVSSAAIGGDLLFAKSALDAGLPWRALLPFEVRSFREDFSECEWLDAESMLSQAADVTVVGSGSGGREEAYLECGLATVEESDIFLALWDGRPARGKGGTAEIVKYVRILGKPLILINPETGHITRENFDPSFFEDPEIEFLESVGRQGSGQANPGDERAAVESLFKALGSRASRVAPRFRAWTAASVILNVVAAILGGLISSLHFNFLNLVILALILLSMVAALFVKFRHSHRYWVKGRAAAEICRYVLACWDLPDALNKDWPPKQNIFSRLAISLKLWRMLCKAPGKAPFPEIKRKYVEDRIGYQITYHEARFRRLSRIKRALTVAFWAFSIASAMNVILAWIPAHFRPLVEPKALFLHLPLTALPAAAGCAMALISVFDLTRQVKASKKMSALLGQVKGQLEAADDLQTFSHIARVAESAMLEDVFEWYDVFSSEQMAKHPFKAVLAPIRYTSWLGGRGEG